MSDNQPTLPGFELPAPGENAISAAALTQLSELREMGVLTDEHQVIAQLVLSLSQSVGAALASGKLTIAAVSGAKLLMEAIELLPEGGSGGMADLAAQLKAVA